MRRLFGSWLALLPLVIASCECEREVASPEATATATATASSPSAAAIPPLPPVRPDVPSKCRTLCRITGRCSLAPEGPAECFAASDADCRSSRACTVNGMCTAQGGICLGTSDADCESSLRCKNEGLCKKAAGETMTATNCMAKTDADCAASKSCKEQGRCKAIRGRCDDPSNPIKPNTIPDKPPPF